MLLDPRVKKTAEGSVKLIYSKSKVYVHPSSHSADFIAGYLSLVENSEKIYLVAWAPETKDSMEDNLPDSPYALSAPISTIHSIVINPPSLSKWYGNIVINFKQGPSAGPYWFHDDESQSTVFQKNNQGGKLTATSSLHWGGDEFITHLSQLVPMHKSNDHEYLVNPLHPLASLSLTSTQMDPLVATLKEARWHILEKLSRVTKFSKETAVHLLNRPTSHPESLCHQSEAVQTTMDDYDSARIFLAKWAAGLAAQSAKAVPNDQKYRHVGIWGHDEGQEETALGVFEILNSESDQSIPTHTRTSPVTEADWRGYFDQQGQLIVPEIMVKKHIFSGGLDHSVRKEAWLFLTGVYPWQSTRQERQQIAIDKRTRYDAYKATWSQDHVYRQQGSWQDQKHRIDKDVHRTDRTVDIYMAEDLPNPDPAMHVGTNLHLETLKAILCTYNVYHPELGYVQGMSDLLSPLYAVIEDEALSFWAFVGFMDRMQSNFYTDQSGMHQQLLKMDRLLHWMDPSLYQHLQKTDSGNFFFCFRWLLVWYKREFVWKDMMTLWEVLWTDYLTDQFHLFIALAILDQHRDVMMDYLKTFDEILKYINDLSMTIPLQETLQRAEILYRQFQQRVEAVDHKRAQLEETSRDSLPVIHPLLREI
ncbi:putative GTPase activating protein [Choanephora cucurbitarum]|nr:putative GTPase activating protein [Choanephora cucurbitarum]